MIRHFFDHGQVENKKPMSHLLSAGVKGESSPTRIIIDSFSMMENGEGK